MTEIKRDLRADLAICEAAENNEEYYVDDREDEAVILGNGGVEIAEFYTVADAAFYCEARTGWPIAIERAINAEAENVRMRSALERISGASMSLHTSMADLAGFMKRTATEVLREGSTQEADNVCVSYRNGHAIDFDWEEGAWYYVDSGKIADIPRECIRCGRKQTAEGHDACLANLPGVINACCGHGTQDGYVMFEDGRTIRGKFNVEGAVTDGSTQESGE